MWLKTLNVTDSAWHTNNPHCGSIGHVLEFPESCVLANELKFDAVNLDFQYLRKCGPAAVTTLLNKHQLQAAAFAFTIQMNTIFSELDFKKSLREFNRDCFLAREAGCHRCVGFIQPSSNDTDFYKNFNVLTHRLKQVKPILIENGIKLGLEFIGPTTMRLNAKYDFIHTIDGLRALIASANCENVVGLKLDSMHWYASGAGLLDIQKMSANEIIYVEIMDAVGGYNRLEVPEFSRRLPNTKGVIDVVGFLRELNNIGYRGPLVVEPWNEELSNESCYEAATKIKKSIDECMIAAGISDE